VFDASVKIPPGLITGNYKQLGNFDECLRIKNEHGFIGQACNAAVQFEISADHGTPRHELDLGDLLVNVAIASVSIIAITVVQHTTIYASELSSLHLSPGTQIKN